ncbi:MAG: DUF4290 domain-containing protein [Bacteroidales bacterium]|nr:DUF4290 domain-containing protein [Bacteroidales bacterium]MDE6106593.1 DUF4290 domain-containing protein [Bacteroidales bacterium]
MRYNTLRKPLIFPEYGRGIQEMVSHALTIEDRHERNLAAQTIIKSMQVLNPDIRQVDDYLHKLYDQLFIMSDYKLDIDAPFPMPDRQPMTAKCRPIPYKNSPIRFRYYGRIIERLILKAAEMPEGEERTTLLNMVAGQMRKLYYTWNDDMLRDEVLAKHLELMSGGRILYDETIRGKVNSAFYAKPSPERKNKFINLSPYDNPNAGKRYNNGHSGYGNYGNNHRNGGNGNSGYKRYNNNRNNIK